jgi:manganese-dependent ADP-ribose/CDP-alcohol diphosphatase
MKAFRKISACALLILSFAGAFTKGSSQFEWATDTLLAPPCSETPDLKIGLISDPQYCDCDPSGSRVYREVLKKLPVAIDSMNRWGVDFVMNLGDMIDRYVVSYDSVSRFYNELTMPYYNLLGNHEFEEIPDNLKPFILSRYGMTDYYYGFSYKKWRFLVLDGTELATYSSSLHPELAGEGDSLIQQVQDKINNKPWNGGIGREQRGWIRNQLKTALDSNQQVILFCHFPVYPDSVYLNLWNEAEVIQMIEEYPNVVAYINGHFHEGNYGYLKGIHYLTQAAMLDTYEHNTFSLLEIYTDKLVIHGFGRMPDRILPYHSIFRIPKHLSLTTQEIQSDVQPGSFIGRFYNSPSLLLNYYLTPDSSELQNSFFSISHDSLFIRKAPGMAGLDVLRIRVTGIDCQNDTIQAVFELRYNALPSMLAELNSSPLTIYPNPVAGKLILTVEIPSSGNYFELSVIDIHGKEVQNATYQSNEPLTSRIEIALDDELSPGMYFVRISQQKKKDLTGRFILHY